MIEDSLRYAAEVDIDVAIKVNIKLVLLNTVLSDASGSVLDKFFGLFHCFVIYSCRLPGILVGYYFNFFAVVSQDFVATMTTFDVIKLDAIIKNI